VERFNVGDVIGFYVNGVLQDRGRVLEVIQPGIYRIGWERGRVGRTRAGDDLRRERGPRIEAWLDFLDLPAGLTEEAVRSGANRRKTYFPWPLAEEHKRQVQKFLEARGFDVGRRVWAQERPDRDGFYLTQYDDD
jgi:hypothetical protein